MEQNTARDIIEAFGGLTALSRAFTAIGSPVPISTIQHWGETGRIPYWRVDTLKKAAKRRKVDLSQVGIE